MTAADLSYRNGPRRCHGVDLEFDRDELLLYMTGIGALLSRRRSLVLPRRRVHRAFVLGRRFAITASPRLPALGLSTGRLRVGTFGIGERAQLWSVGRQPVVVALYLRGEPYHRIVLETDEPAQLATEINNWASPRTRDRAAG
jgi:hypothetical protein